MVSGRGRELGIQEHKLQIPPGFSSCLNLMDSLNLSFLICEMGCNNPCFPGCKSSKDAGETRQVWLTIHSVTTQQGNSRDSVRPPECH